MVGRWQVRLRDAEERGWWPGRYAAALLRRFVALQFFDRSLAIAAQMLVAFLPLIIGLTDLFSDPSAVGHEVVRRFSLGGATAAMVELMFSGSSKVERTSWAWVGWMFFLTLSLWLLGRRVRHLYERALDVPPSGSRSAWRGLAWLLALAVLLIVPSWMRVLLLDAGPAATVLLIVALVVVVFGFCCWSPRFLLVGGASWRASATVGAFTFLGVVAVSVWSRLWMPNLLVEQGQRYGAIGVSFAMFTWLYAIAIVLVAGATLGGAVEDVRLRRQPASTTFPV